MKSKSKLKNNLVQSEELCFDEELDENGICESPITGTPVAQFSFVDNYIPSNEPMLKELQFEEKETSILSTNTNGLQECTYINDKPIKDNLSFRSDAYGVTPPVNGEYFDTRRSFTFRKSTVRKLNELKANHPDINVYLNTIVDNAICHYYDYISKEKGPKKLKSF